MANVTLNVTDNQGKATGTVDAPAETSSASPLKKFSPTSR